MRKLWRQRWVSAVLAGPHSILSSGTILFFFLHGIPSLIILCPLSDSLSMPPVLAFPAVTPVWQRPDSFYSSYETWVWPIHVLPFLETQIIPEWNCGPFFYNCQVDVSLGLPQPVGGRPCPRGTDRHRTSWGVKRAMSQGHHRNLWTVQRFA